MNSKVCPKNTKKQIEVVIKKGRIVDNNCLYLDKDTKGCTIRKEIPYPICILYGKKYEEEEVFS